MELPLLIDGIVKMDVKLARKYSVKVLYLYGICVVLTSVVLVILYYNFLKIACIMEVTPSCHFINISFTSF